MQKLVNAFMILCLSMFAGFGVKVVQAADPIEVNCNNKYDLEFIKPNEEQKFAIKLPARAVLEVTGEAVGGTLEFVIQVIDTLGRKLAGTADTAYKTKTPTAKTDVLSATGTYTIITRNGGGGIGLYSIIITCSGTVPTSEPVDATGTPSTPIEQPISAVPTLSADFVGFSGLQPVSFDEVDPVPLELGKPEQTIITVKNSEIVSFAFDAKANDVLDLNFLRKAGNLNLGLVLLSKDNKLIFQASLITSSSLNTQVLLPSDGQYTIGVFKVDLLPPSKPAATKFEITAKLNP